jgi:hypothetical protein
VSTAALIDDIRTEAMAGEFKEAREAMGDLQRDMSAWGHVMHVRAAEFMRSAHSDCLQGEYFGDPSGRRARFAAAELAIVARLFREYGITD